MVIDFHTHVFPEKIAERTIAHLSEKGGIPPFSDGTVNGILARMEEAGVDCAVNLPVVTAPKQFDSVNRFATELNTAFAGKERNLLSFAGIHPECEEIDKKMKWIRENGFLGVKIHPDYQGTFINADGYVRIMECAKEYDLIVVTHAGVDVGFPECTHCTPALTKELIRKVPHSKFVIAHMGGNEMWDEVLELLCDEDVYFDTAYVLRAIGEDMFKKLLARRGADRILFASDSPWSDMTKDVEILKSFSLGKETEKRLFSENAKSLLNL